VSASQYRLVDRTIPVNPGIIVPTVRDLWRWVGLMPSTACAAIATLVRAGEQEPGFGETNHIDNRMNGKRHCALAGSRFHSAIGTEEQMSKLLRLTTVSLIALMGLLGSAAATMAAPVSQEGASVGAAQGAAGTVVVTDYICDGQTGVVWGGAAGANCYAGSAGFVFYLIGDGTDESWSLSVNGSGSISLPVGTYEVYENIYWAAGTVEVTAGGTSNLSVLHPGAALPPPPPADRLGEPIEVHL
jgi:hypothetical protein